MKCYSLAPLASLLLMSNVTFSLKTARDDGSDVRLVRASEMTHYEERDTQRIWSGHPLLGASFTAIATLTPASDGTEWSFAYSGNTSDRRIEEVSFPEWTVPRSANTKCLYPNYNGIVRAPQWDKIKPNGTLAACGPAFMGFRFIATYDDGKAPSHYLDQRGDARYYATRLHIQAGTNDTVVLKSVHEMPLTPDTKRAYRLPYTGVMATYDGGWFEACAIYRAWVKTQSWYQTAAARDFGSLKDVALWMWNRGTSDVTVPPAVHFMRETGLKVALDWYWWHNVPYDTSYPHFWPPREDVARFKAGINAIHAAGGYVQPYTNGMLWDCDEARWAEGGDDSVIVERNGKPKATMFNPYTKQRQAWMCGEAQPFHAKMRFLERTLRETGMDGVYMDMIASAAFGSCFNPRHKHPMGGGRHLVDGYRAYVNAVRRDNPGLRLSSEENSDTYLDVFDSFIYVYPSYERFKSPGVAPEFARVPASLAVYHGAIVAFGSFATMDDLPPWDEKWGKNPFGAETTHWEEQYPDQFAVEFARGVSWGLQPTVHKFLLAHATEPRFAYDYAFVKHTARFYHDNRDLLFDGEMLAPGDMTCKAQEVRFLCRSAYTKPEKVTTVIQPALPTLFHSAWRSKSGRKGAVVGNWSRTAQSYAYRHGDKIFNGIIPARTWVRIEL